jgi:predicted DNA-binding transcriptional regulator YafY
MQRLGLPPIIFTEDELAALVLGSRSVADRADRRLAAATGDAIAKIAAILAASQVENWVLPCHCAPSAGTRENLHSLPLSPDCRSTW